MLFRSDREETAALAEIEAALRRDDPDLVSMIERFRTPSAEDLPGLLLSSTGVPLDELLADAAELDDVLDLDEAIALDVRARPHRRWRRRLSAAFAAATAVAVTLAVTMAWGPDAGGLTGVVTTMAATLYGYQVLRGCPGRR